MKKFVFTREVSTLAFEARNRTEALAKFYDYQDTYAEELDNWNIVEEVASEKVRPQVRK